MALGPAVVPNPVEVLGCAVVLGPPEVLGTGESLLPCVDLIDNIRLNSQDC